MIWLHSGTQRLKGNRTELLSRGAFLERFLTFCPVYATVRLGRALSKMAASAVSSAEDQKKIVLMMVEESTDPGLGRWVQVNSTNNNAYK